MMTASKWTWSDTTPTASGITISGELRPRACKPYSLRLLNQFFIGVCDNPAQAKPAEPEAPTMEFLQILRSITGALHTFDE
ncbi:unnamed protein product, partial [Symbiodinium microadriaticum]